MHYFLSFYYYDKTEDPVRKKLKEEFERRNKFVAILERKNSKNELIHWKMLNEFLSKINKNTLESVTIIDCDLILSSDFKEQVEENIKKYYITHNCSLAIEYDGNNILYAMPSMTQDKEGHSGFSWSFSKRYLELIEYKFPEGFTDGALDFFIAKLYIQDKKEDYFKQVLGPAYDKLFKELYDKTKGINAGTINQIVLHCSHGVRKNRMIDTFRIYNDEKKIKEFLEKRNSN